MDISKNFISIQGWMATDLNLSGNNLLLYALIYGFSQDSESEFKGSLKYICTWLNCSKPTAMKALLYLVDKNLILKESNSINGVVFNKYKANLTVVKNLSWGGKETLPGMKETLPVGGKETLPNNIYNNINNNNSNNIHGQPDLFEFLEYAKTVYEDLGLKFSDYKFSIESKYESWKASGWKDGNGKKIKNWKTKLRNTIPFLKPFYKPEQPKQTFSVL